VTTEFVSGVFSEHQKVEPRLSFRDAKNVMSLNGRL